ncbi:Crp/Fnr family transcriptional regulator [Shewanella sp. JL219SE-S6]
MQLQPYSTGRFSAHLKQSHQAFCDAMLECCGQSQLLLAGEDLLSQGRELTHMCLVPEGRVSMNICAVNGRRFQLGELDCDWHLFGEMEFFTATSCQWSVVAEEPMEIRQLCLKKVRHMLLQQPEFTLFLPAPWPGIIRIRWTSTPIGSCTPSAITSLSICSGVNTKR